jgi:Na+/proline symporter
MEYFKHIFALFFIILLMIVVFFILKKGSLHFKLLKEMYPGKLKQINSIYNPFSVFYILGFNIETILWFSTPIYFSKNKINESFSKEITNTIDKLLRNNIRIYFSISILLIWFFIGLLFVF